MLLVRILPFLIGDKVEENDHHWECFLLLRKIIDIVLAPVASEELSSSLKLLIKEHHTKFVSLYGISSCIPKMHFLIHYPEQMLTVGPMVRTWTMRQEAKLNFFKQCSHLANFKNLSFSLANRHQRWACYEFASGTILHFPLECGPPKKDTGITYIKDETKDIQDGVANIIPQIDKDTTTIFHPRWIYKNGVHYKCNNAYLIVGTDGLDPLFGQLDDIMVLGGDFVIFLVSMCSVLYFDSHYHAYTVTVTSTQLLVSKLFDHNVYHSHKLANGQSYIYLKYFVI